MKRIMIRSCQKLTIIAHIVIKVLRVGETRLDLLVFFVVQVSFDHFETLEKGQRGRSQAEMVPVT